MNRDRYGTIVKIGEGHYKVVYPGEVTKTPRAAKLGETPRCYCRGGHLADRSKKCWVCWFQQQRKMGKVTCQGDLPAKVLLRRDFTTVVTPDGTVVSPLVYVLRITKGEHCDTVFVRFLYGDAVYSARIFTNQDPAAPLKNLRQLGEDTHKADSKKFNTCSACGRLVRSRISVKQPRCGDCREKEAKARRKQLAERKCTRCGKQLSPNNCSGLCLHCVNKKFNPWPYLSKKQHDGKMRRKPSKQDND